MLVELREGYALVRQHDGEVSVLVLQCLVHLLQTIDQLGELLRLEADALLAW